MTEPITGETIGKLRKAFGLTQEGFARLLGLRLRAYSAWESNGVPQRRNRRPRSLQILHALLVLRPVLVSEDGTLAEFAGNVYENDGMGYPEDFLPAGWLMPVADMADSPQVQGAAALFEAMRPDLYRDIARIILGSLFLLGIPSGFQEKRLYHLREAAMEFGEALRLALGSEDVPQEDRELIEKELDDAGKARLKKLVENPEKVIFEGPESIQLAYLRGKRNDFQRAAGRLVRTLPGVGRDIVHGVVGEVFGRYLAGGWRNEDGRG